MLVSGGGASFRIHCERPPCQLRQRPACTASRKIRMHLRVQLIRTVHRLWALRSARMVTCSNRPLTLRRRVFRPRPARKWPMSRPRRSSRPTSPLRPFVPLLHLARSSVLHRTRISRSHRVHHPRNHLRPAMRALRPRVLPFPSLVQLQHSSRSYPRLTVQPPLPAR